MFKFDDILENFAQKLLFLFLSILFSIENNCIPYVAYDTTHNVENTKRSRFNLG